MFNWKRRELDKIVAHEKLLKFILENNNLNEDQLKKISTELFVGVLGNHIILENHHNSDKGDTSYQLFCNREDKITLIDEAIGAETFQVNICHNIQKIDGFIECYIL